MRLRPGSRRCRSRAGRGGGGGGGGGRRNADSWVFHPPLFVVADGMGGARAGESRPGPGRLAGPGRGSRRQRRDARRRGPPGGEPAWLRAGAARTGRLGDGHDDHGRARRGDRTVSIGHVGDSRAYLILDGQASTSSPRATGASRNAPARAAAPEEAETPSTGVGDHPRAHTDPDIDVDPSGRRPSRATCSSICSDGLTSMVGDEEILDAVEPPGPTSTSRQGARRRGQQRAAARTTSRLSSSRSSRTAPRPAAPGETKPMPAPDACPAAGRRGHAHRARPPTGDRHDARAARRSARDWQRA